MKEEVIKITYNDTPTKVDGKRPTHMYWMSYDEWMLMRQFYGYKKNKYP